MEYLRHFIWLAKMTMDVLLGFWPITLILLLLFCIAAVINSQPRADHFMKFLALNLLPLIISVSILLIGTFFFDTREQNNNWLTMLIVFLIFSHLPVCIFLTAKMPERGWFTVTITLIEGWISVCAAFISLMSVSNDWL